MSQPPNPQAPQDPWHQSGSAGPSGYQPEYAPGWAPAPNGQGVPGQAPPPPGWGPGGTAQPGPASYPGGPGSYPGVPGQPAGYPPGPAPRFKAVRPLGLAVIILAAAYAALRLAAAVLAPAAVDEFLWALDAGTLDSVFTPFDAVGALAELVLLAGAVVSVIWLWRARGNTFVFSPSAHHVRGQAWVILGWVVPIVSLWFGFQIVRDIAKNSLAKPLGAILGGWWAAWLIGQVVSNVAARQIAPFVTDPSAAGIRAIPALELVAALAYVGAAITWGIIVHRISSEQHLRAAR